MTTTELRLISFSLNLRVFRIKFLWIKSLIKSLSLPLISLRCPRHRPIRSAVTDNVIVASIAIPKRIPTVRNVLVCSMMHAEIGRSYDGKMSCSDISKDELINSGQK